MLSGCRVVAEPGGDRPCLSFPKAGCLGMGIPLGTVAWVSPARLHSLPWGPPWGGRASPRRSGIPGTRHPCGEGTVARVPWRAPRAHPPWPWLARSAWAGPAARLPGRPRELRSHALLILPGTCPSSRRLRASKEPINPPGARGSGSGSSSSPANEGQGEAWQSRLLGGQAGVSRRCPASHLLRGGKWVN